MCVQGNIFCMDIQLQAGRLLSSPEAVLCLSACGRSGRARPTASVFIERGESG